MLYLGKIVKLGVSILLYEVLRVEKRKNMKTLTLEAEIASDGRLRLDVPSGLPPGKAEIVLVIQPASHLKQLNTVQEFIQQPEIEWANGDTDHVADFISVPPLDLNSIAKLSHKEKMDRIGELLTSALQGVEWAEIEEGK